jgi:hypothetical protein
MVKYGREGQSTDDNVIRRMHFACWIAKATNTHSLSLSLSLSLRTSEYVRLLFNCNSGFANAP